MLIKEYELAYLQIGHPNVLEGSNSPSIKHKSIIDLVEQLSAPNITSDKDLKKHYYESRAQQ